MKKEFKIYLEEKEFSKLKFQAEKNFGLTGRGWLSHLLSRLSQNEIILIDGNTKKLLSLMEVRLK